MREKEPVAFANGE